MNLVAIMPARNEGWVLGLSARAALRWCDHVVILDHASTDDTPEIIKAIEAEFPTRVVLIREESPEWAEMAHRQKLLEFARMLGATHIAPVDADEVLSGDLLPTIRGWVERLRPGYFGGIKMSNLHRSIHNYRADISDFGSRAGTMLAFADDPKLCWQTRGGYDHHQRSPLNSQMQPGMYLKESTGGLMHLQFASWRRLLAKHAAYKVMERLKYPSKPVRDIDRTYSQAPDEAGLLLSPVPEAWWAPYADLMGHLDLDRDPWQEATARRLVERHGAEVFTGLDLFGVA